MTYPGPEYLALNIIALDFDGVLVENNWPLAEFGAPIKEGAAILAHYSQDHAVIIHTSRPASHEPAIWQWLEMHGLRAYVYDVQTDKLKAALYVDDRAWNPWGNPGEEGFDGASAPDGGSTPPSSTGGQQGSVSVAWGQGPSTSQAPAAPPARHEPREVPEDEIETLEIQGVPV